MVKDKRNTTVKNLIAGGFIRSFNEIIDTIPKTVIATDPGINSERINNLMKNVDRFIVKGLFKMAALPEVMKLICNQI